MSANFERLVNSCVEAEFCKCSLRALDEIYKIYICVFGEKRTEIENKIMNIFATFEGNLETMESASGKRLPSAKHNPGEENSRPQQCSEACGK